MPGQRKKQQVISAREAALKALVRVERDGAYLNLALPPLLQRLPDRDRALAARLAAGTVQRLNTLDWCLALLLNRPPASLTPWIRNLLRLSAYQLLYLDRIPAHAAVDEGVRLARRYGHCGVAGLVNAVLRRLAGEKDALPWPVREKDPLRYLSLVYSHPEWLVKRWLDRYGTAEAEALCRANNEPAPLCLRPNRLRIGPAELQRLLLAAGVSAEPAPRVPGVLLVKEHRPPAELPGFEAGLFTVQGESSALVAPLLDPQPEEKVLDLCSAPGGKTTHLAELMGDRGEVMAVDMHRNRLRLVERAAGRLGLTCIRTMVADGRRIHRAGISPQDRVLVDAPCSGLGVIRRLPELKWRRSEADLAAMCRRQLELLEAAAAVVKPGGSLLYSVCSIEPEETGMVAEAFSRAHPSFSRLELSSRLPPDLAGAGNSDGTVHLFPHRHCLDGFYIALWRRQGARTPVNQRPVN